MRDCLQQKRNERNVITDSEFISEDELIDEEFLSIDNVVSSNTIIPKSMVNSIPNEMGINLNCVNGFSVERQPDKQIKKITIDFMPEK